MEKRKVTILRNCLHPFAPSCTSVQLHLYISPCTCLHPFVPIYVLDYLVLNAPSKCFIITGASICTWKSELEISLHSTFPRCKMHLIYSWIHLWCCQVPISWQMDWHPFSLACLQFSYTWQWTFGNFQIVNLLFFKKMTIAIACLTPQIQTAN